MKICTKCKEPKDEEEFPWSNMAKGIRGSQCKLCRSTKFRENYGAKEKVILPFETHFNNIDSCSKAYCLGLIYSDGCIMEAEKGYRFALQLARKDIELLEIFCKFALIPHQIQFDISGQTERALIKIQNRNFCESLIGKGVTPRKTGNIRLPFEHLNNQEDLIYSFILGYFDGDGYKGEYCGNLACGNIEFLEDVHSALNYSSKIQTQVNHWGSTYMINIPKKYFKLMYEYFPYSLTRKKFSF